MKFHPFAQVWPLLEGPKFDKLVGDIKAHGLHYPITTYQGMILDGCNRFRACALAGVAPRYEVAKVNNDHDAILLSVSLNEHRRHMDEDALAFVAAQLATMSHGGNMKNPRVDVSNETSKPVVTREEAAEALGISVAKVNDARAIRKHAPELEEAVKTKKISMRGAATEARERKKTKGKAKKTVAEIKAQQAEERKHLKPRNLTREQVDPEFVGDAHAWAAEYGHVQLKTSLERSTSHFSIWTIAANALARQSKQTQLPKITDVVLSWLRSPKPADVEKMTQALNDLEQFVGTARDLLRQAQIAASMPVVSETDNTSVH